MAEPIETMVYEQAVTAAACQLAIHPVLALLALQDDGAPEAEAQIRDCAEKIVAKVAPMIWDAGRHTAASDILARLAVVLRYVEDNSDSEENDGG